MKKYVIAAACLIGLIFFACKKEQVFKGKEPIKSISGSWKIIKATRNGTDLTERFDFSQFRIKFTDSSYALTNAVPFMTTKDGTWHFDDPVYPFQITLTAPGESKSSTFMYPVVNGVRNIILSFSPGCTLNTYQYTLQKDN